MSASNVPYPDDPSKNVRDWMQRYKSKFGEDPTLFSAYGWTVISQFQKVNQNAGPNLTTDSWIAAMEKQATTREMFGADEMSWSKTKHLGTSRSRLSQIQGGRWMVLTDYLTE